MLKNFPTDPNFAQHVSVSTHIFMPFKQYISKINLKQVSVKFAYNCAFYDTVWVVDTILYTTD